MLIYTRKVITYLTSYIQARNIAHSVATTITHLHLIKLADVLILFLAFFVNFLSKPKLATLIKEFRKFHNHFSIV